MMRISARSHADVLAAVKYRLGFTPSESTVFVSLNQDGLIGLIARIDREVNHQPGALAPIVNAVRNDAAEALIMIAYTQDEGTGQDDLNAADQNNPDLLAWPTPYLWASPAHYRSLSQPGHETRPISDTDASPVAATFAAAGASPVATRADLAKPFTPAPTAARRAAGVARTRWAHDHAPNATETVAAAYDAWHAARTAPRPIAYGHLAAVLANRTARDHLMAYIATSTKPANDADLVTVMDQAPANGIDVLDAIATLAATAAHSTGPAAAPALATAGWLQWWLGDGDHRLANLTDAALGVQLPPPWAMNR